MCGAREILLKSWKKPHNLSPILAPAPGTPGNPGKNLTICGPSPGPPEILEKTSQSADHHRDPGNPGKKPHNITDLLVVVVEFRQAVQRPPAGAINLVVAFFKISKRFANLGSVLARFRIWLFVFRWSHFVFGGLEFLLSVVYSSVKHSWSLQN